MLLKLYKEFNEKAEELVLIAFHTIQLHFTTDNSNNPAGTAALTMVSSAIGLRVAKVMDREAPWNMQVRLGDLFIESFYNCGFIDIYYPKARDTSYIISATNRWLELAEIPDVMSRMSINYSYDTPQSGAVIKTQEKPYYDDKAWVRAVNKLQHVGWRINKKVYDTLRENKDRFVSSDPVIDNDAKEMKRRSKTVEWAFIMAKAKMLRDKDTFYQTVECDYRGRIYYKEAFLNFQGSDLARGMLEFSRRKPMTESGLWWLAVHTACCYNQSYSKDEIPEWAEADYLSHLEAEGLESISVDKFTLEDRVRWTNENMAILVEAGRTCHLFMEAEKTVSLLAACIEWYEYSEAEAANRIHFTHLPLPVDGSNNGWQHLGAMSKDPQTGKLVGLVPQDIQSDFYVQTAKKLHSITKDERRLAILDAMPMKHIRKGISKRGSMTRAYSAGAGKIGENMWFDCKTEDYHEKYEIEEKDCMGFARDLVKAIDAVCPGPLQTMGYLQNLASYEIGKYGRFKNGEPADKEFADLRKRIKALYTKQDKTEEELQHLNDLMQEAETFESQKIYGNGNDYLTWVTPSEFPVKYEDYAMKSVRCRGTISGLKDGKTKQIKHVAKVPTKMPDVRSFMCGVSPNFVHSMDAAHMALVIDQWNNDFGAVHDSFAVHACDVDDLLDITKQTFVEMYDVDNFFDYIRNQLTNMTDDVEQPALGSLDIQEVYYSDYFFA